MPKRRSSTITLAAEIVRRRLESQRLSATTFSRPDEVVAWLGALQAQDYLGALWAIGLRLGDARERDVERALAERRIVRTWPMRGTLHFLAAADVRWMTELLAPKAALAAASRLRALGIDASVLSRARRALVRQLEGGRQLTRPAAYRSLERAKIRTEGGRGLHVLWRLAHDGLLCFGPRAGKQQTLVLLDEWLPPTKKLFREEALAELAHRYFTGHGPATLADFAWWSGLTLSEVRLAVRLAGRRIEEETLGDHHYWFGRGSSPRRRSSVRPVAHVLPAWDEFLVGYCDRSAAIDPALAPRLGYGGISRPIIVVEGHVVGTWQRRLERRGVFFSTSIFKPQDRSQIEAVERALGRYASFLDMAVGHEP